MAEEILVLNDLTEYGLRRMHVVCMGGRVDRDRWLEKVSAEALETAKCIQYQEDGVDVWHLWVVWNCREVVKIEGKEAALWFVGKGIPMRFAVEVGAEVYEQLLKRWPGVCLAREWPKDAPERYGWKPGNGTRGTMDLKLSAAEWVPQGYVVVMEEVEVTKL